MFAASIMLVANIGSFDCFPTDESTDTIADAAFDFPAGNGNATMKEEFDLEQEFEEFETHFEISVNESTAIAAAEHFQAMRGNLWLFCDICCLRVLYVFMSTLK